jgi:exopolyphosphatase/guanosine-5'-triphosphate,3'-diphosphate pyrophosphatase
VALDRRPAEVLAGVQVERLGSAEEPTGLTVSLVPAAPGPGDAPPDLSLECWSLRSCAEIVLDATGLRLQVEGPATD